MIINFRYHVFTITAIFAALGLGILIGSSIIGNDGILAEQKFIIENISKDIDRLQNRNQNLLNDLNQLNQKLTNKRKIEENLYPLLIKDLLKNKKLCIMYNNLNQDKINEVKNYFEIMGSKTDFIQVDNNSMIEKIIGDNNTSYDQIITWNMDKQFVRERGNLVNYDNIDTLGLITNILKRGLSKGD
ncbi:MAG: copper transporter [Halanaerobiaceae bacterium]